MSQTVTRQNIEAIDAIALSRSSQALSARSVLIDGITKFSNAAFRELITGSVDLKQTTLKKSQAAVELKSPVSLNTGLSLNYLSCLKSIDSKGLAHVNKQKIAVLNTIMGMNYMVKNNAGIQEKLQDVIEADAPTIKSSVKTLMNEIQSQHNEVFIQELQNIVTKASAESGFNNVTVRVRNATPIITALNEQGQGIISEIQTDRKTKSINLVSETTDFFQGECSESMKKFDEALKRYGVKVAVTNRKWTGGNCLLPLLRSQDKNRQKDAKNEMDRTRNLNKPNRIKH